MATQSSVLAWRIPWTEESGRLQTMGFQEVRHDWATSLSLFTSQVVLVVKNLPASAGDVGDVDSVPGPGRSPGGGDDNPLQSSCLENPMDRGAWWATVHRVAQSRTQLKWLSTHTWVYIRYKSIYNIYMCKIHISILNLFKNVVLKS